MCTASREDEITLGLLWHTSLDPVNTVAVNYSNTCMVVESSVWVKDMYDNDFMSLTGQVRSFNMISDTLFL